MGNLCRKWNNTQILSQDNCDGNEMKLINSESKPEPYQHSVLENELMSGGEARMTVSCERQDVAHIKSAHNVKSGNNEKGENKIRKNFHYLKDNLDVDCGLLDYFIQEDIFTEDQVDLINAERTRRRKVDCLLRMLLRSSEKVYNKFLDFLTETDNDHIRNTLESDDGENNTGSEDWSCFNTEDTLHTLNRYKNTIIKELQPETVMDYFVQYGEFTTDEYEEVISKNTRKKQAEKLMTILATDRHIPGGYVVFLKALKESGDVHLLHLLQSKTEMPTSSTFNVTCPDVEFMLPEEHSQSEDADELLVKIQIVSKKNQKQEEREIIKTVKNDDVKQVINDTLLSEICCVLDNVTEGSIILRIKGCRHGAIKQLLLVNGYEAGVSRLLGIILSHPDVKKYTDKQKVKVLKVEIKQTPNTRENEVPVDCKKIILNSLDFLKEELDPKRFMDLEIFTKEEKEIINKMRATSRAKGTQYMLDIALAKSEDKLGLLIEEIKQTKEYVWTYMFQKGNHVDPREVLVSKYTFLVDNICPSSIVDHCAQGGLLSLDVYQQFISDARPRTWITKFILQEVLKKSDEEIISFLHVISTSEQNWHCTALVEKANHDLSEEDQGVASETDDQNDSQNSSLSEDYRAQDSLRGPIQHGMAVKVRQSSKENDNVHSSLPQDSKTKTTGLSISPGQQGMQKIED